MSYHPRTIDTSHVTLSSDLAELIERLAQNNHDHWAQSRIDEGCRYGPKLVTPVTALANMEAS